MQELQSLEDIYNKRIFRIPDYQRGYAWEKKQLIDFWEDLLSLDGNRLHYTGVLSIKEVPADKLTKWDDEKWLIEKRKFTPFYIIDGQQRLTTTSIFLQCLVEAVRKFPANESKQDKEIYLGTYNLVEIIEKFIVVSQPPLNTVNTYKFGYELDNPSFEFLRHKIYSEPFGGTVIETFYTLNLENAKVFFTDNLDTLIKNKGYGILEIIYEKLTQKFMFNLYEISDDFDVFVAFETMNNRGKKLSDLELLKNRLIYLTTLYTNDEVQEDDRRSIRKNINDAWREVYFQLGRNKKHPLNDDDFLRAHWIMYFKYSRKKGDDYIRFLLDDYFSPKAVLHKVEVNTNRLAKIEEKREENEDTEEEETIADISLNKFKSSLKIVDINKYVLSLKSAAKHWYETHNPESNEEYNREERILVDRLNRIGMGYFRPLVMALFARESIHSDDRKKLLNQIERFIFIVFRLARAQSNYRNSRYYGITKEVYSGEKTVSDILTMLNEDLQLNYNPDGTFKYSYFKDYIYRKFKSDGTGFYGWNGLRYFLFEYEESLMAARNVPKIAWTYFAQSEKDKVSIEHIYPQTADADCWDSKFGGLSDDQKKYYNGTLGNLLPLSLSVNSSLQNDCFQHKKSLIKDENGKVKRNGYINGSYSEQEVAAETEWGPEQITKRGLKLLTFMEERWGIYFGDDEQKKDILHLTEEFVTRIIRHSKKQT